jgi:hypothetical protein
MVKHPQGEIVCRRVGHRNGSSTWTFREHGVNMPRGHKFLDIARQITRPFRKDAETSDLYDLNVTIRGGFPESLVIRIGHFAKSGKELLTSNPIPIENFVTYRHVGYGSFNGNPNHYCFSRKGSLVNNTIEGGLAVIPDSIFDIMASMPGAVPHRWIHGDLLLYPTLPAAYSALHSACYDYAFTDADLDSSASEH